MCARTLWPTSWQNWKKIKNCVRRAATSKIRNGKKEKLIIIMCVCDCRNCSEIHNIFSIFSFCFSFILRQLNSVVLNIVRVSLVHCCMNVCVFHSSCFSMLEPNSSLTIPKLHHFPRVLLSCALFFFSFFFFWVVFFIFVAWVLSFTLPVAKAKCRYMSLRYYIMEARDLLEYILRELLFMLVILLSVQLLNFVCVSAL